MVEKKRNTYVDFLRGAAMLIVVLGHTMTGSTTGSESSVLFNIVWSLQMPLFILISGYVTRYSHFPENVGGLIRLLGRRTLAYLLPWFVFTILFDGVVLGKQSLTSDVIFYHMDSGYWFLISLWTISMIFIPAHYFAHKLCRKKNRVPLVTLCFYLLGMVLLAGLGFFAGINFWCIKLTLYYMPFYFLGYLFGFFHDSVKARFSTAVSVVVAAASLIWIIAIIKLDIYALSDTSVTDIMLRAGVSLCGCVCVCGLLKAVKESTPIYRFINWIGVHSLEIYLLHRYFLNLIVLSAKPEFTTAKGIGLVAVNYVIAVSVVAVVSKLLGSNRWLNLVLFGKMTKKR